MCDPFANVPDYTNTPIPDDDDELFTEEALMVDFDIVDEVYLVKKTAHRLTVHVQKLNPVEKVMLDEAVTSALKAWIDNEALRRVKSTEVDPRNVCPMRILMKWAQSGDDWIIKARIIMQGFKILHLLDSRVEKESGTLSRTARYLLYVLATHLGWKFFTADVKSAFLQSREAERQGISVYCRPSGDIRKRLAKLMDLAPDEDVLVVKPGFGDPRAPRLWSNTALMETTAVGFESHRLEQYLFLSYRPWNEGEDFSESLTFVRNNIRLRIDGIMGLHVDDYVGALEGVHSENDLQLKLHDGTAGKKFQDLTTRFKFGKIDFVDEQLFCGVVQKTVALNELRLCRSTFDRLSRSASRNKDNSSRTIKLITAS